MIIKHKSQSKNGRFNEDRDKHLHEGFHSEWGLFCVDDRAIAGLLARKALLELDPSLEKTCWPTADNQMAYFNREEFFLFLRAVLEYRDGMFLNCWKKKGRKV